MFLKHHISIMSLLHTFFFGIIFFVFLLFFFFVVVVFNAKLFYRHQLQFGQARPVGKHAALIAKVCFL